MEVILKFSNELTPDLMQSMKHLQSGWQAMLTDPKAMSKIQEFWTKSFTEYADNSSFSTPKDRRFKHELWTSHPLFSLLKDNYLKFCQSYLDAADQIVFEDTLAEKQFKFFLQQFLNCLSPSNNPYMNPEVIEKAIITGGQSFVQGTMNYLNDLQKFQGLPNITMVEESSFEVGKDVAITPGKVVFENDMMQLIAYQPENKVFETPLLIIPPWINKYYILDLSSKNSFVKWLTERGQQVFMISWKNPTVDMAENGFEQYMDGGPNEAYKVIEKLTKSDKINALGFCIGGTLLSITQSYRIANKLPAFNSLTYLTSLIDFSEPGDIEVFIDEHWVNLISEKMEEQGLLDGRVLGLTFSLLRSNDLYWSFFINNYLLGEKPADFDLLYWNSDSTNLPRKMHDFYLRQMYLANNLIQDKLEVKNQLIKVGLNKAPCFFLSTEQDHIAPWATTYNGALEQSGEVEFVLGGSGHIAGVINPPTRQKYGFRTSDQLHKNAQQWYEKSSVNEGSWWPHYQSWLSTQAGKLVDSMYDKMPEIEKAPGRYVKERL